jgi:hypothetical protein
MKESERLRSFGIIALGEDWDVYGDTIDDSIRNYVLQYCNAELLTAGFSALIEKDLSDEELACQLNDLACCYAYEPKGYTARSFLNYVHKILSDCVALEKNLEKLDEPLRKKIRNLCLSSTIYLGPPIELEIYVGDLPSTSYAAALQSAGILLTAPFDRGFRGFLLSGTDIARWLADEKLENAYISEAPLTTKN